MTAGAVALRDEVLPTGDRVRSWDVPADGGGWERLVIVDHRDGSQSRYAYAAGRNLEREGRCEA